MVTSKEQARQIIQKAITDLAGVAFFNEKNEMTNILLDLEWNLREHAENNLPEIDNNLPEELGRDREMPWEN